MQLPFVTVTVPIDASPQAQHGIDYALDALRAPATIHFCSVVDPSQMTGRVPYPTADPQPFLDAASHAGMRLGRLAAAEAVKRGLTADCAILIGSPVDAIARFVQESRSDAVVLCTHGRHGIGLLLAGSISEGLLHRCRVPIVVVHAGDESAGRPGSIVCAVDDTPHAGAVVRVALRAAQHARRPLSIVHVVEPGEAWENAAPILESAADIVRESETEFELVTLRGHSAAVILEHAGHVGSPMIVTGTHGRGAVARAILGSIAAALTENATVPVVVVPPVRDEDPANGAFTQSG